MSQIFDKVKVAGSARSTFDLSHHQVTSSDFGYIIPICYRDMLPNDDFTVTPKLFCRLAPLAAPTYGRITCRVHSFFVPYRILYPHWDAFITQDESNHTIPPYFTISDLEEYLQGDPAVIPDAVEVPRGFYSKVMSNLGIDPRWISSQEQSMSSERISAFPFLAYYRIWLDYFMDSSLNSHTTLVEQLRQVIQNGGDVSSFAGELLQYRNACFKKDYFTTMRKDPQLGNPAVVGVDLASTDLNPSLVRGSSTAGLSYKSDGTVIRQGSSTAGTSVIGQFKVEALRLANALQRYSERSNFVGSKLINQLLVHFGISPTAERLDMAEFLGGSSFPIQIGDVTSTSQQSATSQGGIDSFGLGAQAGKGVGAGESETIHYHAKEHGIFMTVMSILPDTGYYQGLSRFWTKGVTGDALDYASPEFANLGYQEVLNQEFYVPIRPSLNYQDYNPRQVLGYQPRYAEYKFAYDVLGSDFVAVDSNGAFGAVLDSFHLFRKLKYDDTAPLALNNNLVECDNKSNDYDRIFQITDSDFDHFYFNIDVDIKAVRDLPSFAEPSIDSVQNLGDGNSINLPYGGTRL